MIEWVDDLGALIGRWAWLWTFPSQQVPNHRFIPAIQSRPSVSTAFEAIPNSHTHEMSGMLAELAEHGSFLNVLS